MKVVAKPRESGSDAESTMTRVVSLFEQYVKLSNNLQNDAMIAAVRVDDPNKLADTIAAHLVVGVDEKQNLLEIISPIERLNRIAGILEAEVDKLQVDRRIQSRVKKQMEKAQKEYYLNEKMKAIQKELGRKDEKGNEIEELKKKIEQAKMPSIFGVVVQVDELAVAQAADLEPPERRVALQRLELLAQLLCCEPVEDGRRKPLDACELPADVCVDGEERLMEPAPACGLRAVLEDGRRHAPGSRRADTRCSATRSRTIGATSRLKAVSVSGSGGAASMKVLKPRSVAKCVRTSAQCSGGPTIAWSPSVAGA